MDTILMVGAAVAANLIAVWLAWLFLDIRRTTRLNEARSGIVTAAEQGSQAALDRIRLQHAIEDLYRTVLGPQRPRWIPADLLDIEIQRAAFGRSDVVVDALEAPGRLSVPLLCRTGQRRILGRAALRTVMDRPWAILPGGAQVRPSNRG